MTVIDERTLKMNKVVKRNGDYIKENLLGHNCEGKNKECHGSQGEEVDKLKKKNPTYGNLTSTKCHPFTL